MLYDEWPNAKLLRETFEDSYQEPTEEELLQNTAQLAKEVKEFEKLFDIRPNDTLTKSENEKKSMPFLWIWVQKKGVISPQFECFTGTLLRDTQDIVTTENEFVNRIRERYGEAFDYYIRKEYEYADPSVTITRSFSKEPLEEQIIVICHEDLHQINDVFYKWPIGESIVTPLGYLFAMEFLKHKKDFKNLEKVKESIKSHVSIAKELRSLTSEANILFNKLPLGKARPIIRQRIDSYTTYSKWYGNFTNTLEAKLSHDLAYFSYFDRIVVLYENGGLKSIFTSLKTFPPKITLNEFETWLCAVEKKYSIKKHKET